MTLLAPPPSAAPPAPPRAVERLRPRRPRGFTTTDLSVLGGSALAGVSLTWLVFDQITPLSGAFGFGLCAYGASLVFYSVSVSMIRGRRAAVDRVATVLLWTAAAVMLTPLLILIGWVFVKGIKYLGLHYFLKDDRGVGPLTKPTAAGGEHAIIGTLLQNGLAALIGGPLAVLTAVYLNEVRGPFVRGVRTIVTAMSGIPSIVAGLFIYSIWVSGSVHAGYSGFAAALALTIILLPTVTRTTEEVLRLVPGGLREASLALGAPEWRTTWSVVLPTARSGMITAMLLGIALTVGETAPVFFTAFGATETNINPFSGPQASLPLVIYQLIFEPSRTQVALAFTTALVLMFLVLALFLLARIAGGGFHLPRFHRRRVDPIPEGPVPLAVAEEPQ